MTLSHILISVTATSLILQTADSTLLMAGAIASLLPDVDISVSPAGRVLFPLSRYLEARFPHRSATHSISASFFIACADYSLAVFGFIPWEIAHAINLGYFFGYLPDAFTKSGIEMFYPSPVRCVCPGNKNFRLSTGSSTEWKLFIGLLVVAVITLNINMGGGMGTQVNKLLATSQGVLELYNSKGGEKIIVAEVSGVRSVDRQPVKTNYEILQAHGTGFIVRDVNNHIYKVGTEPDATVIAERITGKEGSKVKTLIKTLVFNDEAIGPKLQQLIEGNAGASIYLTGQLRVDEPEELSININPQYFPIISKSENSVTLTAAPVAEVLPLLVEQWVTGQLTARVIYAT